MVDTKTKRSSKKDKKKAFTKKKAKRKSDYDRGKVVDVTLKQPFTLNGNRITAAKIEIDHINHGLDKKTFKLNKTKRSDFTASEIEKFLLMLDGEYILHSSFRGRILRYEVRIDCPVSGKYFDKTFNLVFEMDYDKPNIIHTITLYRIGS